MNGRSVLDEAIAGSGRVGDLHHELEALQHAMEDPARADEMDAILERFGEVQEEYEHLGGYALEAQAREVLHGLGFEDDQIDGDVGRALRRLEDARRAGARAAGAARRPADGRADESPGHRVDHLAGAVSQVLSGHAADDLARSRVHEPHRDEDRRDRCGEIIVYSGDYDFYERERAIRETNQQAAFARQQAMLAKEQRFIDRFRTHAAKAAQVQSRIKALDKIEKIELPKKTARGEVRVSCAAALGRSGGGDRRIWQEIWAARDLRRLQSDDSARRALGRDGPQRGGQDDAAEDDRGGAARLMPAIVRLGASLKMGYFAQQSLDVLDPDLTVIEQLQNDFPQDGLGYASHAGRSVSVFGRRRSTRSIRSLSGGEKSRLAMARMLYDPPNFLVLDEPTNHLDLATKEMLVEALKEFEGTMIFVSHDRTFLRGLGSRVLELGGESGTDRKPLVYPGSYIEYVQKPGHEAPGTHS